MKGSLSTIAMDFSIFACHTDCPDLSCIFIAALRHLARISCACQWRGRLSGLLLRLGLCLLSGLLPAIRLSRSPWRSRSPSL